MTENMIFKRKGIYKFGVANRMVSNNEENKSTHSEELGTPILYDRPNNKMKPQNQSMGKAREAHEPTKKKKTGKETKHSKHLMRIQYQEAKNLRHAMVVHAS